jgi:hypothetical protein
MYSFFLFFFQFYDVAKIATIHVPILSNLAVKNEMRNFQHPYIYVAAYLNHV